LYCNYLRQSEQKINDLLASLLKQLTEGQHSLPDTVKDLYEKHNVKQSRPSSYELLRALEFVASLHMRVFILIDALDECDIFQGCRSKLVSEISSLREKARANFYITSRPIPELGKQFQPCLTREIIATDSDVYTYLNGNMSQLKKCVLNNPELQKEIRTEITIAVKEM
jgi:hypothetical protein